MQHLVKEMKKKQKTPSNDTKKSQTEHTHKRSERRNIHKSRSTKFSGTILDTCGVYFRWSCSFSFSRYFSWLVLSFLPICLQHFGSFLFQYCCMVVCRETVLLVQFYPFIYFHVTVLANCILMAIRKP